MRAFDQAKSWKIVPTFVPDPTDRTKARDQFRDALIAMGKEYRKHAAQMRRPPMPGPRPPVHEDAPPMPSEAPGSATDAAKPEMIAAQKAILDAYTAKNDEWLDTVFFPNEAERVIWEVANEVHEEWLIARRARLELWRDDVSEWGMIALKFGVGLGGLAAIGYVIWRIVVR